MPAGTHRKEKPRAMRFLSKTLFATVAFCTLLLCGCRSRIDVAATADVAAFPPAFMFSQVRDETFQVACDGTFASEPHFVQNYIVSLYLNAGTSNKDLILRSMQRESERKVRMVEKVLLENGYRKVAEKDANCEIVIRYGEGRRDGRRFGFDTTPRAGKYIFPLGFLQISCDLIENEQRARVWEMTLHQRQSTGLDRSFHYLAYGVGKNLGRTTAGVKAMALYKFEVRDFFIDE